MFLLDSLQQEQEDNYILAVDSLMVLDIDREIIFLRLSAGQMRIMLVIDLLKLRDDRLRNAA